MNFIDSVLGQHKNMSAIDIVQAIGDKIYDEPIDRNSLSVYPQFIQDIVFIIDLNTVLEMNGISGLFKTDMESHIPNMLVALRNIQATNDANILHDIYEKYKMNPDDDSTYELANELSNKLYLYNDFNIWSLLETYVDRERRTS